MTRLAHNSLTIVGIGASAGGLGALQKFFSHLPPDTGMAYVVIVHLDPNHKSQMAELLQPRTDMRVRQVTRQVRLEPNNVYIIPPEKDLSVADGHVRLSPRNTANLTRSPIDLFMRTLAETHHAQSVAIVLSGTGSDGARGIGWIKARGGVTMAQSPSEAEHPGMPQSAIATGQVDVVMPVAELASELVRIHQSEGTSSGNASELDNQEEDVMVGKILSLVRTVTGHDFNAYKKSTINRRVSRRAQFAHAADLAAYMNLLNSDPEEMRALFNDLLIRVTSFFRDPDAFSALASDVIPRLFQGKGPNDDVRVWITGCATGEEAYSLAILLCEHADNLEQPPVIQIFATDIHESAFAFARDGLYSESITDDVSPARLDRYFSREPGGYRVKKIIREKMVFAPHNLLRDPPFLRLDLIACRNLLIYLQRDAQNRVLELFHYSLVAGGTLLLGTSESIEADSELFAIVDKKQRIFRSIGDPAVPLPRLPAAPARAVVRQRNAVEHNASRPMHLASLHRQMVEALAPPSLVVNSRREVVHLSDGVGRFLQLSGGEATPQVLSMVPGDLRVTLGRFLTRALVNGEKGELRGLQFTLDGKRQAVDVSAHPLRGEIPTENFALLIFDEQDEKTAPESGNAKKQQSDRKGGETARQIERELRETRSLLQAANEEHEATIEELKASNEELQSINEEQKATEEELEGSKEELQSINEELRTINQEGRGRNAELAEVNADLINLIDSTEIGTIFLDRELRLRRYTPTITSLFNVLPSDLGRPLSDLTHRLDHAGLIEDARQVLRTLGRLEREVAALGGKWFAVRSSPYRSHDDRIDGVVITFIDTTDRKLAEIEKEALLIKAESSSEAKSNFIGVMSHELRTPLNAIVGYADLLTVGAWGPVSDLQSRHLGRITACARHLSHLIEDSLQSSRIEAGAVVLALETVDVSALVGEVVAAIEPLATAKRITLDADLEDGVTLDTDVTKLRQIVFNVVGNAVRFTDNGGVTVSSRKTAQFVLVSVEDTGIGIGPEHLERVFERFWQVDQTKTRVRGGTGLGLMVSRSLAQILGGDITVTSEPGRGSCFTIKLPLSGASTTDAGG